MGLCAGLLFSGLSMGLVLSVSIRWGRRDLCVCMILRMWTIQLLFLNFVLLATWMLGRTILQSCVTRTCRPPTWSFNFPLGLSVSVTRLGLTLM